jgi:ribose 1,5-bisphosphokinase
MNGGFVLLVGPSGAGKDTLLGLARDALAGDARFLFPRRVITRPPSPSEANESLVMAAFDQFAAAGGFCLHWQAHGLCYGIPAEAEPAARGGRVVVVNVSRAVVAQARRQLPCVTVVEVTAPPDQLASRIAGRRREARSDQSARLARNVALDTPPDLAIVNDRAPEAAAAQLIAHLRARAAGIS